MAFSRKLSNHKSREQTLAIQFILLTVVIGFLGPLRAGAAGRPSQKWDHELITMPNMMCHRLSSGKCHCFGDELKCFIHLYKCHLPVLQYPCAKWGAAQRKPNTVPISYSVQMWSFCRCAVGAIYLAQMSASGLWLPDLSTLRP